MSPCCTIGDRGPPSIAESHRPHGSSDLRQGCSREGPEMERTGISGEESKDVSKIFPL
jgi:hypothetical protein